MALNGKKIALFVADLYNEHEFWYPYYRLLEEGAELVVIGPEKKSYHAKGGMLAASDVAISDVSAAVFDGLLIPGGYAPDYMRRSHEMVDFVRDIFEAGKPVAVICHAGWMLCSAGVAKGKNLTSYFAIKDDLINAGANWEDSEVVVDGNLITARSPKDLPAFMKAFIASLS